jgi:hypothetical protein
MILAHFTGYLIWSMKYEYEVWSNINYPFWYDKRVLESVMRMKDNECEYIKS